MKKMIVAIAEHFQGGLRPVTYELVTFAAQLQKLFPCVVKVVIVGDDIERMAKKMARDTGLDVVAIQAPNLSSYNGELYLAILEELLSRLRPQYALVPHTTQGWDYAPRLAVRLGASCITGVTKVFREGERICFARTVFNGKLVAVVHPSTGVAILTVQPGIFGHPVLQNPKPGSVELRSLSFAAQRSQTIGIKRAKEEDSALSKADVIVSAGRGIGKKENLDLIRQLAGTFPKSAVGGSRPVCDLGWLDHRKQVGLTGAMVAPKLYMACGISGAPQHIAGMGGADFIVAINTDPGAAIFNVADVCIIEDLTSFIPAFLEACGKRSQT